MFYVKIHNKATKTVIFNTRLLNVLGLILAGLNVVSVFAPIPKAIAQFGSENNTGSNVYQKVLPAFVTISIGNNSGSGSIVSPQGFVLTNEHVVRGSRGGEVTVRTRNGKTYRGQVIALDRRNDLALIQLPTQESLPTVRFASPEKVKVGQQVFAIGSPFGLTGTLTTGILSRIAPNGDLQTDAALNPGNSGGPLLNTEGELIGVNKAILSPGRRGNTGIGFATNVRVARNFIEQNRGRVNSNGAGVAIGTRPVLGVLINPKTLVIESVNADSVAERSGLKVGDSLVEFNGNRIQQVAELYDFMDTSPKAALVKVKRNGKLIEVRLQF